MSGCRRRYPVSGVLLVSVALGVASLAPAGASAQSRTLGSGLTQAPNAGFGCEAKPTLTEQSYNGDYAILASGQADCTWYQAGVIGASDYSDDPRTGSVPADGFITNVAVRSGPNPSALRIVIIRKIGGLAGGNKPTAGCCAFVSETPPPGSPPLQPQPNTATGFDVNIPVERNVRGTSAVADYVGISGVSGAGTLPLLATGNTNFLTGYTTGSPAAGFLYPRLGALEAYGGGTRHDEGIPGVEVLLQWTWAPSSAAFASPAAPFAATSVAPGR